jgi:hypothetical protein
MEINLVIETKLKKEIEVEEIVIYPIFRKITDDLTGKVLGVFKADEYTITKVVCGSDLYPSIQVFENNKYTLSAIYWQKEVTKREYMKYLRQTLKNLNHGMEL